MRKWILLLLILTSCASNDVAEKSASEKKFELYYSYGTDGLLMQDYSKALDFLLQAEAINANDSKLQNNLGMAYFFKGQPKLASQHLQKAIDLDEKNSDAKNNLAGIYFRAGDLGRAKNLYVEVLNDLVYRFQFRTKYNLGLISLKQNNTGEAKDYFIQSITENEDYCPAHYELGNIYYQSFLYAEALKHFNMATKGTCVNAPAPHYRQAQSMLKLNQNSEALLKLKMIIEKFPTSSFAVMAQSRLREVNVSEIENMKTNSANQSKKVNIDEDPNKILDSVQF